MFAFILLLIYFVSPQPRFTLIAEGSCKTLVLLVNNRTAPSSLGIGASEFGSKGLDRHVGVIGEPWYGRIHTAWPLEARNSLERSPRALIQYLCC